MTVIETVLIFGGIPLGVVVVIALLVYGRSAVHQPNRYRPGKAWTYPAAWYEPHPQSLADGASGTAGRAAIDGGTTAAVGGANGEW
jgi:hypothetical protein